MESLKSFGHVYGVIGGFHGFSDIDYLESLELVIPTHCTKKREEILKRLGSKAIAAGAGFRMEI